MTCRKLMHLAATRPGWGDESLGVREKQSHEFCGGQCVLFIFCFLRGS